MRKKKPINVRVGSNIRTQREKVGYTQESLSELLGVTPNHLSAIERGISGATLEMLETLCTILGTSADDLLFGSKQKRSFEEKVILQLRQIEPEYQVQIQKMLSLMIEILVKQKDEHIEHEE